MIDQGAQQRQPRLRRQATPPTPDSGVEVDQEEEGNAISEQRNPVVSTPIPSSTTHEVPAVELERPFRTPSVQQLLAQPGFSSGVFIHTGPRHPQFASLASRLATFDEWPPGLSQRPQEMAEAGLIYLGLSDQVKCFYCDGGLREWRDGDDPWQEHAGWFPKCGFVRLVRGSQYVEQSVKAVHQTVEERRAEMSTGAQEASIEEQAVAKKGNEKQAALLASDLEDENRSLRRMRECKVCLSAEVGVVFLPCGHLATCVSCAPTLTNCPVCRSHIQATVRTFLS